MECPVEKGSPMLRHAHLRRLTAPLTALLLVAAFGVAGPGSRSAPAAAADQTVTQPPEPVDPSPINGESY